MKVCVCVYGGKGGGGTAAKSSTRQREPCALCLFIRRDFLRTEQRRWHITNNRSEHGTAKHVKRRPPRNTQSSNLVSENTKLQESQRSVVIYYNL